jgi:hypothetical protein
MIKLIAKLDISIVVLPDFTALPIEFKVPAETKYD